MTCLICLEDTDNNVLTNCNCKLNCHTDCFNKFLKNSNFHCPICRIKKIGNINNRSNLLNIVLRLPPPFALFLWFIISILFSIFVCPFLMIKEIYGKNITLMVYTITVYLVKTTTIIYPMLMTQFGVLCLYYLNIRI